MTHFGLLVLVDGAWSTQVERGAVQTVGGRKEELPSVERGEAAKEASSIRRGRAGQSGHGGLVASFDGRSGTLQQAFSPLVW